MEQQKTSYSEIPELIEEASAQPPTPQIDNLANLAATPEVRQFITQRTEALHRLVEVRTPDRDEVMHRITRQRNKRKLLHYEKVVIGRRIMDSFKKADADHTSENIDDVQ